MNRSHIITCRLSDAEADKLEELTSAAKMPTSYIIRQLIMNKGIMMSALKVTPEERTSRIRMTNLKIQLLESLAKFYEMHPSVTSTEVMLVLAELMHDEVRQLIKVQYGVDNKLD